MCGGLLRRVRSRRCVETWGGRDRTTSATGGAGAGGRAAGVTRLTSAPPKPGDCQLQLFDSETAVGRPFEAVCLVKVIRFTGP
jgi:hypothetical protein